MHAQLIGRVATLSLFAAVVAVSQTAQPQQAQAPKCALPPPSVSALELRAEFAECVAENAQMIQRLHEANLKAQSCEVVLSATFEQQRNQDQSAAERASEQAQAARKAADAEKQKDGLKK